MEGVLSGNAAAALAVLVAAHAAAALFWLYRLFTERPPTVREKVQLEKEQ